MIDCHPTPRLSAATLAVLLACAGCASTPPAHFYTLIPLEEVADRQVPLPDTGPALGLGPMRFPDMLDRPQMVSRSSGNQLVFEEFHRWGGSLSEDFLRTLGENLAHLLGTARILVYPAEVRAPVQFRLVGEVLHFEGGADGQTRLRVRWALVDPLTERFLVVRESSYRHRIEGRDPAALAAALSASLGAFSREVAAAVEDLDPGRSSRTRKQAPES